MFGDEARRANRTAYALCVRKTNFSGGDGAWLSLHRRSACEARLLLPRLSNLRTQWPARPDIRRSKSRLISFWQKRAIRTEH